MIATRRFNRSITIIGWCFIVFGLLAAVNVIGGALNHRINLDLNVFALPTIGIGILQRRAMARIWALIVLWITTFELILGLGVVAFNGGPVETNIFGRPIGSFPVAFVYLFSIPLLALIIWQQHVLARPDVKQQLSR
jgi:hypothetical protein